MKIPALFKAIIDWDRVRPKGDCIPLNDFRGWHERRRELTKAAEAYVARQRGGGGSRTAA